MCMRQARVKIGEMEMKEEGETDTVRPESFWIVARRFESAVVAGREVVANCGHTQSL